MSRKTRKLIWSAPLVAVLAVAGALIMFVAQGPGSAQATHEMLPGAPQNVTIMPDGHHAIKLSWDAPSSGGTPTGYRIDRSKDNGTWFTHEDMHTGTSFTDTGLDAGSTWFYRVFAYNTAGTGPVSEDRTASTMPPTNPSRVQNLTATATGQNSTVLTWQAPEKNGGADIKHYEIHFTPNPDGTEVSGGMPAATVLASAVADDTVIATDGPVLTYSHTKLTAETRYLYIVYAMNEEDLKGTVPSAVRAATTADLTAPGRPEHLTAVQSNADTVQLYWYVPADNGGTDVTGYDTEVRKNCRGDWEDVTTEHTNAAGDANDASWTLTAGADRETSACFRVRAHNSPASVTADADRRFGAWSSTATLRLHADEAARALVVPLAVTGGAATYTNDRAKVTWTASDVTDRTATRISSYRVDVSEDGISWMRIPRCFSTNRADDDGNPFCDYAYDGGEARTYRVLAQIAGAYGPSITPFSSTASTEDISAAGHVRSLMARAVGPTQIDVSWTAPAETGGSDIDHYRIQATMMGATVFADWPAAFDTADTEDALNITTEDASTSYSHMELKAGQTWRYRVFAVNKAADGTDNLPTLADVGANAEVDQATTPQETMPRKPEHLSVEMASTSNSVAAGSTGLLLLWNAPMSPAGADIAGYQVQRMKNDGAWETVSDDPHTMSLLTDFTDTDGLEENETRAYRVRAVSENDVEGAWSDPAYYPQKGLHNTAPMDGPDLTAMVTAGESTTVQSTISDPDGASDLTWNTETDSSDATVATATVDASTGMVTIMGEAAGSATITVTAMDMAGESATQDIVVTVVAADTVPGAPTGVSATADSATQITVSWTAPANNGGAAITHYIIERRYDGDMMGDIPSDGYNDDAGGRSFAFSNHMEWWETLNCKGMLAAAGSDADPTMDSADKSMYCAHYSDTAPTNMAGTIMADDATDMAIEALFDKRYVITADAMTTYVDMDLKEDTKYTYRVSAVNAVGRSAWSMADMATTQMGNVGPSVSMMIEDMTANTGDTLEAVDLSMHFTDADDDALTYTADSSDEAVATVSVEGSMLTITPMAAGMTTITVKATDADGSGMSAMDEFTLTLSWTLTPPEIKETNPVGSGIVLVSWDMVPGATGYTLIAVNLSDRSAPTRTAAADSDDTSGQIQNLTTGDEYLVFVGAFNADLDYELSDYVKFTAE